MNTNVSASVPCREVWKVGDFAMMADQLVELSAAAKDGVFAVTYWTPSGDSLRCGGSSMYWTTDQFRPVTDPSILFIVEVERCMRERTKAEGTVRECNKRLEAIRYALGVIRAAVPPDGTP